MNGSPYFTGAAPNFGPPSGLAGLINSQQNSQMDTSGFKTFADIGEKYRQVQDAGKAADYFVKANPDALSQMGIHEDQWKTLGSRDKSDAVTGLVKGQAVQETMQRMADYAAQAKERDAQAQAMQNTGTFMRAYAGALPSGVEDTPENRLAQGFKALPPGANIGRVFPQAMTSLEKFASLGANNAPSFVVDTNSVPGWALTGERGSKQWQALPTGSPNVQMVDDGNGNVTPVVVSQKGNVTAIKTGAKDLNPKDALAAYNNNSKRLAELNASLQMADDPKFSSILDKDAIRAEMADLQQQQDSLKPVWQKGAKATTPAPAAAKTGKTPAALPTSKADLKAGTLYQTSRGPATWDGKQFIAE